MNRLGIQSLNAGAPDLRLSGDQTQRGTYTQRRRNQMAYGGIAGLDGRKAYGIGSWFQKAKDKVVDDFIPNEIKENPLLTAAILGGASNYMDIIPGDMDSTGWINNLLGGAGDMITTGAGKVKDFLTPGTFPDYSGVTGVYPPGMSEAMKISNMIPGPIQGIINAGANIAGPIQGLIGDQWQLPTDDRNIFEKGVDWVQNKVGNWVNQKTGETVSGDTTGTGK